MRRTHFIGRSRTTTDHRRRTQQKRQDPHSHAPLSDNGLSGSEMSRATAPFRSLEPQNFQGIFYALRRLSHGRMHSHVPR
jgi:hypothetical protein